MASDLTNKKKKEWAKVLYLKENATIIEIAAKVGVSRVTLSKWIKEGKWQEMKVGLTLTKEEQIQSLLRQVAAINDTIDNRKPEEGPRFATSTEADTISKIAVAIKRLEGEVGISDIISVGIKFLNFLRKVDANKAKEVATLWDSFVKDNI